MENIIIFKSYLRLLLHDLKELKKALQSQDHAKAEELIDSLITDTQKGLED